MDSRFEVKAQPRTVPPGLTAETPPVSLAWRALEAWQQELKKQQQAAEAACRSARTAWIALADESCRLARLARSLESMLGQEGHSREAEDLRLMVRRLERVLGEGEVECLSPVGEPYTVEMSDYLMNLDQKVSSEVREPTVLEVIEPVVRQNGEVIRPGKAIIAVPAIERHHSPEGQPG